MAQSHPSLVVILSPTAIDELWRIWGYNAARYGDDHAEGYEAFLKSGIAGLSIPYAEGKPIAGFPEIQSLTLRRNRRGEGHIVIYEVDEIQGTANVLSRLSHENGCLWPIRRRPFLAA